MAPRQFYLRGLGHISEPGFLWTLPCDPGFKCHQVDTPRALGRGLGELLSQVLVIPRHRRPSHYRAAAVGFLPKGNSAEPCSTFQGQFSKTEIST